MRRMSVLGVLWQIVFFSVLFFLQQNYGLQLGFRFSLIVDQVLHCLAPVRMSLKTQSKIEFLELF